MSRRDEQNGGSSERPDPQVGKRGLLQPAARSHCGGNRCGERLKDADSDDAGQHRHDESLHDHPTGRLPVSASHLPGDKRGCSVGDEVEHHECHREYRGVHAQRGEGKNSEAAYEHRVHDRHEGVRGQRAERGQREREDFAIESVSGQRRGLRIHGDEDARPASVAKCPRMIQIARTTRSHITPCQCREGVGERRGRGAGPARIKRSGTGDELNFRAVSKKWRTVAADSKRCSDRKKEDAGSVWSVTCHVSGRREDAPGSTREHYNKRKPASAPERPPSTLPTRPLPDRSAQQRPERNR